MKSNTARRISYLVVFSFVLLVIAAKELRRGLQPGNLTSAGTVSGRFQSGGNGQGHETLDCKIYSDCNAIDKSCSCDSLCDMYKDCCMNAPPRRERPTTLPDLSPYMSCMKLRDDHIWVVSTCPLESNETCYDQGQVFSSLSNVLVTDDNNITYSNHRCAQCHGVSKYSYWILMISHGILPNSQCNESTDIVCDDFENTTEICINALLKKKCHVAAFPPEGTSVRRCIESEEITNNMACRAEYLPIVRKNARMYYRNVDCCAKLEGECTGNEYSCWIITKKSFAFDSRIHAGYPAHTVFSFAKGCNDVSSCGEVKYHGTKYKLKVRFKYKTKTPDVHDSAPLVCLLTKYFDETEDDLSVLDGHMEMWKASAAYPYSFLVLNLRLESKSAFTRQKDIEKLKDHLGTMMFSVSVNDKDNAFVMESIGEEAIEYNVSGLPKEETRISNKFVTDWFGVLKNEVCEYVQDPGFSDIPFRRCKHLNISVTIDVMNANIVYKCLSFANLNAPGSLTPAPTGGADYLTLDRNILFLLLPTMSLALVFLA